ncbi:hypothetical protein [Porphyromonas levii]|uniref:hypothetical protein n=1 Tax=Porphyromonas levii TaxID=28114 RepID=UPI0014316448|nr:hypothetical protein [Porphyromonas levii]MBR8704220.1 hypothetical protein [Porphyromonas levii]MBR8713358.1 hypothetical protein [Porphyromonas levii]MBR8715393.1 hypothetical protein [Porphyromonas levii]MBR8727956.1 hypothetical protein [Porphyromonas levii]MBR8729811.1 hypothetical protein [Porphyromonas levii]
MNDKLNIDEFSTEMLSEIVGGAEYGSLLEGCFELAVCCYDTTLQPSMSTTTIGSKRL